MATIPSLALIPSGYKASKVYSVLPTDGSGDFDFTRSGNATRVNSEGLIELVTINVPRLNYPLIDGVVSGCPSLLLEPSRSNLVQFSEQFDNAYWTKTNATITANNAVSPDGFTNADKLVEDSTSNTHLIRRDITTTAASYTFTVYAKAAERSYIFLYNTTAAYGKVFNLSTGTVGTGTVGTVTASIQSAGNGWYRCSITGTATAAANAFRIYVLSTDTTSAGYTGDGTSGILIYGAQIELGAYGTSYINTLGAAVTRGADDASKTGISSLIGSVGTLFVQMKALENGNTSRRISLSDGTLDNRVTIEYDEIASRIRGFIIGAGVASSNLDADGYDQTNSHKIALVYNNATLKIFINGVLANSITATMVPTGMDRITTFTASSSSNYLFAELNQLLLFTTALSDADCIALTA